MLSSLSAAFNVIVAGIGLCFFGYMVLQIRMYQRQAAILASQAAQVWKWRLAMGISGALVLVCFCGYEVLRPISLFDWLLGAGVVAGLGFLVSLLRLSRLER